MAQVSMACSQMTQSSFHDVPNTSFAPNYNQQQQAPNPFSVPPRKDVSPSAGSSAPNHLNRQIVASQTPGSVYDASNQWQCDAVINSRKRREFTSDDNKDPVYWEKRRRNNEAAKRSREKRRINDIIMETKVLQLTKENSKLKAEIVALKRRFGVLDVESVTGMKQEYDAHRNYEDGVTTPRVTLDAPNLTCADNGPVQMKPPTTTSR
uniref:CCAAT/enhancer-binding protein beta-like n=1 Tax=Saccoglossus kowalevskii TaxID=10224 RepID=A0ABM0GX88_SACKO|nr:PREDICTED: CCAAT/enhancer-binding protein beta-like [Saccoglossus kowalevskii]